MFSYFEIYKDITFDQQFRLRDVTLTHQDIVLFMVNWCN